MSQPDEMIEVFLINNTRLSLERIKEICEKNNPRDAKMITALEITKIFHGEEKAQEAQERFVKLVQKKETAENVPEIKLGKQSSSLLDLLRECLEEDISSSQIRRLIKYNSVKIDGETKNDFKEIIEIPKKGMLVKVGKKKWFRVFS
jgi:tyrosyl-tRNA synthetase